MRFSIIPFEFKWLLVRSSRTQFLASLSECGDTLVKYKMRICWVFRPWFAGGLLLRVDKLHRSSSSALLYDKYSSRNINFSYYLIMWNQWALRKLEIIIFLYHIWNLKQLKHIFKNRSEFTLSTFFRELLAQRSFDEFRDSKHSLNASHMSVSDDEVCISLLSFPPFFSRFSQKHLFAARFCAYF